MSVQEALSVDRCHCTVQVPVPLEGVAVNVTVPPVQIVETFETMDTEGSATTIICASLDVACGQNTLF